MFFSYYRAIASPTGGKPTSVSGGYAPPHVKLKAAGGIRTLDGAIAVVELGCDRFGASKTAEILDELRSRLEL